MANATTGADVTDTGAGLGRSAATMGSDGAAAAIMSSNGSLANAAVAAPTSSSSAVWWSPSPTLAGNNKLSQVPSASQSPSPAWSQAWSPSPSPPPPPQPTTTQWQQAWTSASQAWVDPASLASTEYTTATISTSQDLSWTTVASALAGTNTATAALATPTPSSDDPSNANALAASSSSSSPSNTNMGAAIGGAVAALVLLMAVAAVLWIKRDSFKQYKNSSAFVASQKDVAHSSDRAPFSSSVLAGDDAQFLTAVGLSTAAVSPGRQSFGLQVREPVPRASLGGMAPAAVAGSIPSEAIPVMEYVRYSNAGAVNQPKADPRLNSLSEASTLLGSPAALSPLPARVVADSWRTTGALFRAHGGRSGSGASMGRVPVLMGSPPPMPSSPVVASPSEAAPPVIPIAAAPFQSGPQAAAGSGTGPYGSHAPMMGLDNRSLSLDVTVQSLFGQTAARIAKKKQTQKRLSIYSDISERSTSETSVVFSPVRE
ncbi:hypothetical protein BC830DRAFT_904613 [Chytriomyces sp. MP71]|nr:hypothetical protein BC830DRAFT_904613 [Chytriomyces sp. MP71]